MLLSCAKKRPPSVRFDQALRDHHQQRQVGWRFVSEPVIIFVVCFELAILREHGRDEAGLTRLERGRQRLMQHIAVLGCASAKSGREATDVSFV